MLQNTPDVLDECWFGQGGVSLPEQLQPVKGMTGGDGAAPLQLSLGL